MIYEYLQITAGKSSKCPFWELNCNWESGSIFVTIIREISSLILAKIQNLPCSLNWRLFCVFGAVLNGCCTLSLPQMVIMWMPIFMLNNCSKNIMLSKLTTWHWSIENVHSCSMTMPQCKLPMWPSTDVKNLRGWKFYLDLPPGQTL